MPFIDAEEFDRAKAEATATLPENVNPERFVDADVADAESVPPVIDPHTQAVSGPTRTFLRKDDPPGYLEILKDYLGIGQRKTNPLDIEAAQKRQTTFQIRDEVFGTAMEEELSRIAARFNASVSFGLSDVFGPSELPETLPGTIAGAGASLAGFFVSPFPAAKALIGTRLAPTAGGLRGITQMMVEGGATLGLATSLSSIIPSLAENETFSDAAVQVFDHTRTGFLVGLLFPAAGAIENKPLRMAVGLLVMDKIRAGTDQFFTVDDAIEQVVQGIRTGEFDKKELAEMAYGYLLDMYFLSKVPSMKAELKKFETRAAIQRLGRMPPEEVEQAILDITKKKDIRPEPEDGISEAEIDQNFGSKEKFKDTFEATKREDISEPDAEAVEAMYNRADGELEKLGNKNLKKIWAEVKRATIDTSANVKKRLLDEGGLEGKEAVVRKDLARGASAKADMQVREASKEIYDGLTKVEEKILNRIIQSRRTISIDRFQDKKDFRAFMLGEEGGKEILHPGGLGGKEHESYLRTLEPDLGARLNERADMYFEFMRFQLEELHGAGLITTEARDRLTEAGDYSPRIFIQHIDPGSPGQIGSVGRRLDVRGSGLKRLDGGSEEMMENNSRLFLQDVASRTQRRIAQNDANRALLEYAEANPDSFIEVIEPDVFKEFEPPKGFETVGVTIEGKVHGLMLPSDMALEWVQSDPAVTEQVSNLMGWLSGSKILKPLATGINPEFALTNLPRDIAHIWLTTNEHSPHPPIFAGQFAKDMVETMGDAVFRRGSYQDYINEGGGMGFLTHQGRIGTRTSGFISEMETVLGYLGETSEIWTRLALRNRALKNGKPGYEATWTARNYLDFQQGGHFTKFLDNAFPYLNASVQATRGIFRAAQENPALFAYKVGWIGSMASGLYLANNFINPEAYEGVPDRDKINNWIITTPLKFMDEDGNTRHFYFKVAKDQAQRPFAAVFEAMMARALGDPFDLDNTVKAAQEALPVIPGTVLPPTMSAFFAYTANKDFWLNEDVWRGAEVFPREEYTKHTHPAFRKFGQLSGMSPERTKRALQKVFTYGNIYTSMVGVGMSKIFEAIGEENSTRASEDIIRQIPFVRRMMATTDPFAKFERDLKELEIKANTDTLIIRRELDAKVDELLELQKGRMSLFRTSNSGQMEKLRVEIKRIVAAAPPERQEDLIRRMEDLERTHGIPDRRLWLTLRGMPPEARAAGFWLAWTQANEETKERLSRTMKQVPGIVTENFLLNLERLKRKTSKFIEGKGESP